jgi:hypothetical protein
MTQAMRFDVSAVERASAAFLKVAEAAERLEHKLKDLDRLKVEIRPKFDGSDVDAGLKEMRRKVREATKNLPKAKVEVKVDGLTEAERKLDQLKAKMTSLSDASAKVEINTGGSVTRLNLLATKMRELKALSPLKIKVDVDAGAAMAAVALLVTALQGLQGSANNVNINLNSRTFLGELAEVRREIRSIHGNIEIDADTQRAMEELARLRVRLAELSRMQPTPVVQADTALARHQIEQIEQQLARLNGRTSTARVKVDVDKSWSDALVKVAALGRALALLSIPVALAGGVPVIAALGGAALSASGAIGVLPGALLGAAAAVATLKVGLSGVGDALKNLDDAKKFAEALKKLSPAAREFATAVRSLAPAWNSVRLDVQERLFAGLGQQFKLLSGAYLPSLKSGLGGISTEFNLIAKDFVGFATGARTVGNVDAIFRNITSALQVARPAAQNLAAAFLDIGVVGSELLPELAGELTAATGRFRTFIDEARRSGELKVWIQSGVDTLKTLGSIAGNVGGTLLAVFAAQRQAGASLLDTLDRLTGGMERWARSAEGQRQMIAVFSEIRRTIDAIMPGLAALGQAAAQAVEAFANTGALVAAGQAFSSMATAIAPLLPALGTLAGGVVDALANALSAVSVVIGPIVSGLVGLLGALGPIPGAVVAMALAFKGLQPINALITGLGTKIGGLAGRLGASAGAVSGITRTFSALGTAVPIVGVAVVALASAWDALTVSTDEAARAMDAGGAAAQEAAAGLQAQTFAMDSLKNAGGPLGAVLRTVGSAMDLFTSSTDEARAAMTPLQQAQLDAAMAANVWRAAVEQFGPSSQQANSALGDLTAANDRLAAEQETAASAAKTHADAIRDLGSSMQTQIGTALAYEDAVKRTGEAHKTANDALKKSGANSDDYKAKVLDLARSQEQQAQAAQKAAESQLKGVDANTRAKVGLETYNRELLKLNDGTAAGRDAFVKLASNLDNTGLAALSASAQMTGLKTEVLTLPDGRTVTIVTNAETGKIESYKATVNDLVSQEYVGTVTFVGDPTRVNDTLTQVIQFANGQQATVTFNADNQPVMLTIGQTKYAIDATTGTLQILGNAAPGEADLTGFKLKVDQTTGAVTFEAVTAPADAARTAAGQPVDAPVNLTPNTGPSDAARTEAGNPVEAPVNLTPNTAAADAARTAVSAPTSSTHTINVDAGPVTAAKAAAQTATASIHTMNVDAGPVQTAKTTAQQPSQSLHTLNVDDKAVVDAKSRAQEPTSSMHTINCNDSAVTAAKDKAKQNTSSTHTINVVVTGAAPPRAAGAYTTPRAEGAYATAYANGGMRSMSAARAEIVPARQPRIIGDRMQGDEAFIPVNRSARSQSILTTTASRMGFDLVPRMADVRGTNSGGTSSAMLSSMRSAVSQRSTSRVSLDDGRIVSALRALRGDVDHHGDNAAIVQELRALRRALGPGGDAGDPTARASAARVRSELGAF